MLYSVIFFGSIQDSHWGVEIYRPQDELWYPYGWSIVSTTLSSKEPLSPPSSTPSSTPSPSSPPILPPSSTSSSSTCAAHPPPVAASSSTSLLVHHLSVFFLFYLLCLVSTSGSSSSDSSSAGGTKVESLVERSGCEAGSSQSEIKLVIIHAQMLKIWNMLTTWHRPK